MEVLERGEGVWGWEVRYRCKQCKSLLRIEFNDLYKIDYELDEDDEEVKEEIKSRCMVCKSDFVLEEVPSYIGMEVREIRWSDE